MQTWTNLSESMSQVTLLAIISSEKRYSDNLMGKYIFLFNNKFQNQNINNDKLYRSEHYNRVDKINMNNVKIVSPEKTGKPHFALADEIKQPKSRALDDHHIE